MRKINNSAIMNRSAENPATTHTHNRYLQGKERETVEFKLKILKRKLEHINRKMTDWKDFVFADPLLPFGTIWKPTHKTREMQNAQPTTQPNFALHLFLSNAQSIHGNNNDILTDNIPINMLINNLETLLKKSKFVFE